MFVLYVSSSALKPVPRILAGLRPQLILTMCTPLQSRIKVQSRIEVQAPHRTHRDLLAVVCIRWLLHVAVSPWKGRRFCAPLLATAAQLSQLQKIAQAWASECALEVAVPPVAASAYWSLHSAAAMVATRLGTTLRYILQQHSMWHMAQARPPTCLPRRKQ